MISRTILIVTNMWPTEQAPVHGIFVAEQVRSLEDRGHRVHLLHLEGPGRWSRYLAGMVRVRQAMGRCRPDIIHAHYGFSGVVATTQARVPVVTTFHGSDVLIPWQRRISAWAARRSAANIYVAAEQIPRMPGGRSHLLPCGVDLELFRPVPQIQARRELGIPLDRTVLLFAGAFSNAVKNVELLRAALACGSDLEVELREMSGVSRPDVPRLMSAVDLLVLTSHHEGSPMVVKEAVAVGLPVVAVPVGDVTELLNPPQCGIVVASNPTAVRAGIEEGLRLPRGQQVSPQFAEKYSLSHVAERLESIYDEVLAD